MRKLCYGHITLGARSTELVTAAIMLFCIAFQNVHRMLAQRFGGSAVRRDMGIGNLPLAFGGVGNVGVMAISKAVTNSLSHRRTRALCRLQLLRKLEDCLAGFQATSFHFAHLFDEGHRRLLLRLVQEVLKGTIKAVFWRWAAEGSLSRQMIMRSERKMKRLSIW